MNTNGHIENWKEYRLSFQKQAEQLMNQLTLEEKISLMSGSVLRSEVREAVLGRLKTHYNEFPYKAGGIKEKDIPAVFFVDGTRGVVCHRGEYTCFPVSVLRGATFDTELEEKIGEAIADEVLDAEGNLFAGVCVNVPYHPGWGRAQESYGEDPYLLGKMSASMINGLQKHGVIACVKHFAFNSMENQRFEVNITCDKRTEKEVFLPQFKMCVDAGAGVIMTSYNKYNGEMCGQNQYLLEDILKGEWGFDGFVMSDFTWGIEDTEKAANAGMDLEMPGTYYYGENLLQLVQKKAVSESKINESVLRIIRTLLAHQNLLQKKPHFDRRVHSELALQCAREGITLLRNENQILPLSKEQKKSIVVLGHLADLDNCGDKGSSQVYPPYVRTALTGIMNESGDAEIIYYEGESEMHCQRLARQADAVIIIAGNDYHDEGEYIKKDGKLAGIETIGGDRKDGLGIKTKDQTIIKAVSSVRTDAIVVLYGGSVIWMNDWYQDVGAILHAYYPGMEGGTALGEILFGKTNPSGKLPFPIPNNMEDLPSINWEAKQQYYSYYHGYTLLDKNKSEPLYPFGFGLSYTNFSIMNTCVKYEDGRFLAEVSVKNTGSVCGAEIIQMYIRVRDSAVERPQKLLMDFQRIELQNGECCNMILSNKVSALAYYREEKNDFMIEATEYTIYIGTSSSWDDLIIAGNVKLTDDMIRSYSMSEIELPKI